MNCSILAQLAFLLVSAAVAAAGTPTTKEYHVLPPVTKGNLSIFPIVGGPEYATGQLSRSTKVCAAARSWSPKPDRCRDSCGRARVPRQSGAEVNRLVLINNSDHPLLLLAGEVVTGGKQDRVIGVDRIVPPKSDPIDLSVFCVEPGRWVASSDHFGSMKSQMAQPSVRMPAMAERDQQSVWDMVASAVGGMARSAPAAAPAIQGTTSYAKVMENPEVEKKVAPSPPITMACCASCGRSAPRASWSPSMATSPGPMSSPAPTCWKSTGRS